MKEAFAQFLQNKIFLATIWAWLIAQTIKVGLSVIRTRRFDFRWLVGTGGMPSSHVAGAACLATSMGVHYGFDSAYFALAGAFALVVMFDAQGVRRAAGKQARILNKITEDIYWQGKVKEGQLRELVGHTPIEVFVGMIIGIIIGILAQ
jgi:acid phosphatase family membrane protein YuiD